MSESNGNIENCSKDSLKIQIYSAENSNDSSSRSSSVQSSRNTVLSSRLNFIRPSVLGSNLNSATPAPADDEKPEDVLTANPFVREDSTLDTSGTAGVSNDADAKPDEVDDKIDPLTLLNKNGLPKSNLFAQVAKAGAGSGFVFGQNVHERVVGVSKCVRFLARICLIRICFRTIWLQEPMKPMKRQKTPVLCSLKWPKVLALKLRRTQMERVWMKLPRSMKRAELLKNGSTMKWKHLQGKKMKPILLM